MHSDAVGIQELNLVAVGHEIQIWDSSSHGRHWSQQSGRDDQAGASEARSNTDSETTD